jgi:hypothetical protein
MLRVHPRAAQRFLSLGAVHKDLPEVRFYSGVKSKWFSHRFKWYNKRTTMDMKNVTIAEFGFGVIGALYVIQTFAKVFAILKPKMNGNGNGATKALMEIKDMRYEDASKQHIMDKMEQLFDEIQDLNRRFDQLQKKNSH